MPPLRTDPAHPLCSGVKRAASPSAEAQQDAKKLRTDPLASATQSGASTPVAEADEVKMGAGRPFSEDPYSYLSLEDDQVKTCLYVC